MEPGWYELELAGSPEPDTLVGAVVEGRALVAVLHDGDWRVFADTCTHAECPFTEHGEVAAEDGVIICNCHGAEFSLTDGSVQLEPAEVPLDLLPVRSEPDGRLFVQLR